MRISSKAFSLVIAIIMLLLPGCARTVDDSNIKKIEFWTLQLSDFAPYINGVIKDYEKTHPDVKIKWVDIPFSEGEKRALASVMSNKVPDLINMNPSFSSTLASKGAVIDLRKYITDNDYNRYIRQSWDVSTLGNITFGIPWYITSSITIYNTDFMKKSGLNSDNPPKTYNDLINYASVIKQKTGKYAFMPNLTEDGQLIKIFNKNDIPILSKDKTKALFNTDKAVKELDVWVYLFKHKLIPPESITSTHTDSLERYQAGDVAFILTGANFLKKIKENAPQIYKSTRVSPQIVGRNKKVDFAIMNLVVPTRSKHPKEAVDFALFLTNTKNQLAFCKLAPILPSTVEGINSDMFKARQTNDLIEQGRGISARQLNNAINPIPPMKNRKDLFEIIDFVTQQALLGEKTSKEALDSAVKKWNQILQESNK